MRVPYRQGVGAAREVRYTFREIVPEYVAQRHSELTVPRKGHSPNLSIPIKRPKPMAIERYIVSTQEPRRSLVLEPSRQRILKPVRDIGRGPLAAKPVSAKKYYLVCRCTTNQKGPL
jgi:hypothetical protein